MFPSKSHTGTFEADWLDLGEDGKMHASTFHKHIDEQQSYITGEATATTFFAANPRVLKFLFPDLKLIMLLRCPTERYVSHYRMYKRFKDEGRKGYDFEPLPQYIEDEIELHEKGKKTRILHQGLYAQYLAKWEKVFGKEKLLILQTRDFEDLTSAQRNMDRICAFLGLANHAFQEVLERKYNRAKPAEIPSDVKNKLDAFYHPSNQQLKEKFGIDFST